MPRTPRRRRAPLVVAYPRIAPIDMYLYEMMGLNDWQVSTTAIKVAWRKKALQLHPDRVVEEQRERATLDMQLLNAAKEVLCDSARRAQYHLDGKMPWVV